MATRRTWIDTCKFCNRTADTNVPPVPPETAWVGVCMACNKVHGLSATYDAWRTAWIATVKAEARAEGEAVWKAKGIKVGDQVRVFGQSLLGRFPILGTAKVGASGAYVQAKGYGRLDPRGAQRVGDPAP
jgi:hypothetical protein